ncbi:MAG: 2-hydroxyacyl-CoA dehydratase [bacterium]|nr:2-hydroxyacyl-CoA dehydratase [bacterium]
MTPEKLKAKPLYTLKTAYKKTRLIEKLLNMPAFAHFIFTKILKPLSLNKWNQFNRSVRYSFLRSGGGVVSKQELQALKPYYSAAREQIEQILDAVKNDKPIVWVEWSVSSMILRGFDAVTVCPEGFMGLGYSIDKEFSYMFLDAAANIGVLNEGCSSQKGAMGAFLLNQLPKPAAIVATTLPCDSGISIYQNFKYHTNAPLFVLDAPYDRDDDSVKFFGKQFNGLIAFLEKHLNQKFNWDTFTESVKEYNKFSEYAFEITQMGRNTPCPYSSTILTSLWFMRGQFSGTKYLTQMAEQLYSKARENAAENRGIVKEEKIRVLWSDVPLSSSIIYPWLADKYGAVVISDFLGNNVEHQIDTSGKEAMLEGCGLVDLYGGMSRQAHGALELITDELYEAVETFSPDCIMFIRHTGCRHGWAVSRIIRDACKKIGLPSLFLSADIFDPRECSEEEIQSQIDEFFKSNGLVK